MQQITKTTDLLTLKSIINRISDVPGGVSLVLSNLTPGKVVPEGTPLSAPSSGKRSVCKQAILLATSTTTSLLVDSQTNPFKKGDFVAVKVGGKSYAITAITTAAGIDTMTVGTAIDAVTTGGFVYEAADEQASTGSTLKNKADSILKSAFVVPSATQVIWMADAYMRADVLENTIGALYLANLSGVLEIKY